MTVGKFILRIAIGIISFYFIVSEAIYIVNVDMSTFTFFDPMPIFILSLKGTFIFIALPVLYLMKLLAYFDVLPGKIDEIEFLQAKIFYKMIYFILSILIILRLISQTGILDKF